MLRVKACIDHASFIVYKPKASAQFLTGLKFLPAPFSVPWPSLSVVKGEACSEWILTFHSAVHFSFLTLSLYIIFFWTSLSHRPSETFVMHFRRFFHLYMRWGHDCFFIYVPYTVPHFFFLSLSNHFSWATFTESHAFKIQLYSSVIPFRQWTVLFLEKYTLKLSLITILIFFRQLFINCPVIECDSSL